MGGGDCTSVVLTVLSLVKSVLAAVSVILLVGVDCAVLNVVDAFVVVVVVVVTSSVVVVGA